MRAAALGAVSGLAATGTMTAFIEGARGLGLFEVEPPRQITANVERKAGTPVMPGARFTTRWLSAHAAFGAGAGLIFGTIRGLLPRSALTAGALYGAGVWAAMYPLALPLAGLYPKPEDDKEARAWTIGLAHLVYGITLAAALDRQRKWGRV